MPKFKVRMQFVFEGEFFVKAKNEQEAEEFITKHCGLVIGGDIHSTLPEGDIDWNFAVHPEKHIVFVDKIKSK